MWALSQTELWRASAVFMLSLMSPSCTTTLDPTSLDSNTADQTTNSTGAQANELEAACPVNQGMGGLSFSSCADLPQCTEIGEQGNLLICAHALSYDAASYECRLRGGYLAEVGSQAENSLFAEAAGETVKTNVWLGGRRTEAFVWAWQHSQVVFWRGEKDGELEDEVFVAWQPGEPNNSSTVSDESEKCLALTLGDIDWNDRACSLELPFVCEID